MAKRSAVTRGNTQLTHDGFPVLENNIVLLIFNKASHSAHYWRFLLKRNSDLSLNFRRYCWLIDMKPSRGHQLSQSWHLQTDKEVNHRDFGLDICVLEKVTWCDDNVVRVPVQWLDEVHGESRQWETWSSCRRAGTQHAPPPAGCADEQRRDSVPAVQTSVPPAHPRTPHLQPRDAQQRQRLRGEESLHSQHVVSQRPAQVVAAPGVEGGECGGQHGAVQSSDGEDEQQQPTSSDQ